MPTAKQTSPYSTKTVKTLRRASKSIRKSDTYDQDWWATDAQFNGVGQCGAPMCVAGHIAIDALEPGEIISSDMILRPLTKAEAKGLNAEGDLAVIKGEWRSVYGHKKKYITVEMVYERAAKALGVRSNEIPGNLFIAYPHEEPGWEGGFARRWNRVAENYKLENDERAEKFRNLAADYCEYLANRIEKQLKSKKGSK
jgi:hypothetical protein